MEADKAWGKSWTRRLTITVFTYIIALAWLIIILERNAYRKALVSAAGYFLSTLTLPSVKTWWLNRRHQEASGFRRK